MPLAIVRRAINDGPLHRTRTPPALVKVTDHKLSAAPSVDPDPIAVITPRSVLIAGRSTDLTGQTHSPAGVRVAKVTPAVIRGTGDHTTAGPTRSAGITAAAAIAANLEFGAASPIDPNPALIEAPRTALITRRSADLAGQSNPSAGVHLAIDALAVIR